MNKDQKTVAIGAAGGVIGMIALVVLLFQLLPEPAGMEYVIARIIFTLWMNVLAILPLFAGTAVVANGRFMTDAIDPLRHAENRAIEIDSWFVENTLQQNVIFFVGTMALSTLLDAESVKFILALTIVFILARIVFWIGFRINPLYRAPGMAATAYLNLGTLLSVLYCLVF
jgi:hypothetical protein